MKGLPPVKNVPVRPDTTAGQMTRPTNGGRITGKGK